MNTTTAAPKTDAIAITMTEKDPSTGRLWLYIAGAGYTYASFQSYPEVVECDGVVCVKRGWNSDSGTLSYCEARASEFATAVRK